jgi:hypothetical protein
MKLQKLTPEEIRLNPTRNYNPREWDRRIAGFTKYQDVQFYIAPKADGPYGYDRFFAAYTLPEGMRVFNNVSYGASLTNAGFVRIQILEDGEVITYEFRDATGRKGRAENCKENRRRFAEESRILGSTFTTVL